jgi:putative membrane protein
MAEPGAPQTASQPSDRRRPHGLYAQGSEPDPRFSLANERTALAWVRTALAFVAGGVGLTSLVRIAGLGTAVDYVAAVMCAIGGFVAVSAVLGWHRKELALRTGRPLPAPVALPWLAGAVTVIGLLLAVTVVVTLAT